VHEKQDWKIDMALQYHHTIKLMENLLILSSFDSSSTQISSAVALTTALYGGTVIKQDTTACLRALQEDAQVESACE
jgi:hypothetical protein